MEQENNYEPSNGVHYYKLNYYTYYQNSHEMEIPVYEEVLEDINNISGEDVMKLDMCVERIRRDIDSAVIDGRYPGFWVHRITIKANVEYEHKKDKKDILHINNMDSTYKSKKLTLPKNWDEKNPDYYMLGNYVINRKVDF